jgi:T5SS/PEP-CTERM-associated repeat protein
MPSQTSPATFTGKGQSGNWSDPMNWSGGVAATFRDIVLIPMSAILNGSFVARQLMMLGQESVTINGALTTRGIGPCRSFMVCEGAVATFTPTSSLTDDGGLVVGADAAGTLIAEAKATEHSKLSTVETKIGEDDDGSGTVIIKGAQWQNAQNFYVGLVGTGTLHVTQGGSISVGTSFVVGDYAGASGTVSLAFGSRLTVDSYAKIGGGDPGTPGGTGTMSVASGSLFAVGGPLKITSTGSLSLAGGVVSVADPTLGLQVWMGATVSGFGRISSVAGGINDAGVIQASGGTLALYGAVSGRGELQIAANSTLKLNAATIGSVSIAFAGTNAALDLAHGVADLATISGFDAGDSILMSGTVDDLAWNGSAGVLTLNAGGKVLDTIQFTTSYAGDPFVLTHTGAGSLITLGQAG